MFNQFNWAEATWHSPVFIALVLCSIVTFGAVLERLYYFHKRRGNPDDMLRKVSVKIREAQPREAAVLCETTTHPVGPVAAEILRNANNPANSFEERLYIALSGQKLLLERNLNILGTMATAAPLLGLLGTVWGIMNSFSSMGKTGSAAPAVVAGGVAEALVTTVAGLVIAIPSLILYNHLARRMNVMLTIAENHTRTIHTILVEEEIEARSRREPVRSRRAENIELEISARASEHQHSVAG
jgi:biopolymer transport protein ExbB